MPPWLSLSKLGADLCEHLVNGVVLLLCVRVADVEDVQHNSPRGGFVERGLEGRDEVVRQIAHEADRILSAAPRSLLSFHARVFVSSVAKSLSSAYVPAAVSVLNSVLLPAFV